MRSILKRLYAGEVYPDEQIIPKSYEYCTARKKLSDIMEAWKKKLSVDELPQFESILEMQNEVRDLEVLESFIYGFKLGGLIALEVASGIDELTERE